MPTCSVYKCVNGSSSDNSCRSFRLPPETSPALRQQWLERINRKNFNPTENATVCILHFSEDAFIPESENKDSSGRPRKKSRLKPLAVPTLHMKPSVSEHQSKKRPSHQLVWPCRQIDDHHYVKKRPKLEAEEANEPAAVSQDHDHSYENPENLVEVIIS